MTERLLQFIWQFQYYTRGGLITQSGEALLALIGDILDFSKIDYWVVGDSYDHMYKLPEASRLKHWKSVFQQRRAFRKNRRLKQEAASK